MINHPSIGGFFTHGGWNSTIKRLSAGVPMIFLPFFRDQPMNCHVKNGRLACRLIMISRERCEKACERINGRREGKEDEENKALGWRK